MERSTKKSKKENNSIYKDTGCPFMEVNNKDVMEKIMKYLPVKDVASMAASCQSIKTISDSESLWFYFLQRDFGVKRDPVFDKNVLHRDIYKQEQKFQKYVDLRFNVESNLRFHVESCLYSFGKKNNTEYIKCCLRRGADINMCNIFGETALMFASDNGHEEVIELLLNKGADINKENENGWTALMWACRYSNKDISIKTVQALLARPEIDVNKQNENGWTALMFACRHSSSVETVRALLIHPDIDINKENENGWTALMYARYNSLYKVVELLVNKKAEIDRVDNGV